eukprot:jgi/Phyca11/5615/fgenesh1_pm.PHYCAscaffold_6_\
MMRRRESNLTLDEEEDVSVEIEPIEQPWMAIELFDTLWQNAAQQVSSSCTFTKYKLRGFREETGTDADTSSSFQQQFIKTLGKDLVIFPTRKGPPFVVLAYASWSSFTTQNRSGSP